jgi:hypothetical protein
MKAGQPFEKYYRDEGESLNDRRCIHRMEDKKIICVTIAMDGTMDIDAFNT